MPEASWDSRARHSLEDCGIRPSLYVSVQTSLRPLVSLTPVLAQGRAVGGSMFFLKYEWEHDHVGAILEEDNEKLTQRIDAAVAKLLARINELNSDHGGSPEELEALATAMGGLHKLRIERLGKMY